MADHPWQNLSLWDFDLEWADISEAWETNKAIGTVRRVAEHPKADDETPPAYYSPGGQEKPSQTTGSTGNPVLDSLGEEERALFQKAMADQQRAYGYQAAYQQLFPNGAPPFASTNPELLKVPGASYTQGDQHVDSSTGGILLANGVVVDPTATPLEGVVYPNSDSVPGSPLWMRKIKDWSEDTLKEWRTKLRKLGYPVAKKGGVDAGFLRQVDSYYRYKYFYGKEVPLDAAGEAALGDEGPTAKDAYDPIEAEFDAKSALLTLFPGTQPSEENITYLKNRIMSEVRKAISKGASPEHAHKRGVKALDKWMQEDPAAQLANRTQQREQDENTEVSDALTNAFQLLSSL
jgi:hypothetical protein